MAILRPLFDRRFESAIPAVDALLRSEIRVSPISAEDRLLFSSFAQREAQNLPIGEGYSLAWSYLTQAAHGRRIGFPLGLKFYDPAAESLMAIGYFPRPASGGRDWHFHVVRPMGRWINDGFEELCRKLADSSGQPVYVKKLRKSEEARLLDTGRFRMAETLPWHDNAVLEDDSHPEVILDVHHTHASVFRDGDNELRRKYRAFIGRFPHHRWESYAATTDQRQAASSIVKHFMAYPEVEALGMSQELDFGNMLETPPAGRNGEDFFAGLLWVKNDPVCFYVAERIGDRPFVGVYANIALRNEFRYSSEFLLVHILEEVAAAGVTAVNLGGSETSGLHRFKAKFARGRVATNEMRWLIYQP